MKACCVVVATQGLRHALLRAKQTIRNGNIQEVIILLPVVIIRKKPKNEIVADVVNRPGLPLLVITVPGQGGVVGQVARLNLPKEKVAVPAKQEIRHILLPATLRVLHGAKHLYQTLVQRSLPVVLLAGKGISAMYMTNVIQQNVPMDIHLLIPANVT